MWGGKLKTRLGRSVDEPIDPARSLHTASLDGSSVYSTSTIVIVGKWRWWLAVGNRNVITTMTIISL